MPDKKTYKLGCSIALTGVEEIHGKYELEAIKMAVEEANESGKLPFQLDFVYYNDGADKKLSETAATNLVNDDAVMAVVGCQGSNATLAGAPIYYQGGLAAMTFTGSNVTASEKGYNTFFRSIANDTVHAKQLAVFAAKYLKVKTAALMSDDTSFGLGLVGLMKEAFEKEGVSPVTEIVVTAEENGKDISKQVGQIKENDPELIFFAGMEPECNYAAVELRKAGVMVPFLGTDAIKPSYFLTTPGFDAPGPYQSNVCVDITREEVGKRFAEKYQKKTDSLYSVYTLEAYDSANILIQAMAACGEDVTREKVVQNLKTMEFDCEIGKVSFDEKGEIKNPKISFYTFDDQKTIRRLGTLEELI